MNDTQLQLRPRLISAIALLTLSAVTIATPAKANQSARCCSSTQLAQRSLSVDTETDVEIDNKTEVDEDRAIPVPGTSVSLVPPAGFVLADRFSGFIHPDNLSSVVVAELPLAAHAEMTEMLSSTPAAVTAAFAEQGITLEVETVSNIEVGETQVPLVSGIQRVGDAQVTKYFTLFAGESTLLITFNISESAQLSEEIVIETIQSAQIAPVLSVEQKVAELPFSFEVSDPFQVFDVLVGSAVLLSLEGVDPPGDAPIIIIASSVSPVIAADLATFSTQLLQSTEDFSEGIITDQSPIEFAGGGGYFIQAELPESTVLQYVRVLPNNFYIRLLATGDTQALADIAPTIDAIQRSVEAKL